ncbi:hypothetical protein [Hoeflea sp.]|uniref:hypothetical protein n=1 Tax=Hoeflea sp. TaxID=1940281 RepID=UPI003A8DFA38
MNRVYRISVSKRAIHLESWADWSCFDVQPSTRLTAPANIATAVGSVDQQVDCTVYELQRWRVNNGRSLRARELLHEDLLLWQRLGAQTVGAFEIIHGDDLPGILVILGWADLSASAMARTGFDSDREHIARHRAQREEDGQAAIRGSNRILGYALTYEDYR